MVGNGITSGVQLWIGQFWWYDDIWRKGLLREKWREIATQSLGRKIGVGRINSHVQGTRPNAVSAFQQSISSACTTKHNQYLSPTTQPAYHVLNTCRATRYGWTDTDQFDRTDQKDPAGSVCTFRSEQIKPPSRPPLPCASFTAPAL